jgi:hypothetical protein
MPDFRMYGVEVDIDVDDGVDEFLDNCSKKEIEEVIEWLKDNGYLKTRVVVQQVDNLLDISFKEALNKLQDRRVYLTLEEEQFLINLANKF